MYNSFQKSRSYEYYYVIVFFVILVQLYLIPNLRIGVITSFIILFFLLNTINRQDLLKKTYINKFVLAYLFYNTFSIVGYFFSGIPLSVFFAEWSNSILPVFFFYLSSKEKAENFEFYKITLLVLIFCFLIGYYLWINDSEEYKIFMETTEGPGTGLEFFQSLFGLTATGSFGVIGFLISSSLLLRSYGRNGKLSMIVCFLATILTFRRGSMFSLFIAIIFLHYLAYMKFNFLKKRYIFIELIFIFFIYLIYKYYFFEYDVLFENLVERSSEISQAVGERSFTWSYAFQDLNFIFGKGLGSVGHKSIGFSKILIADGNYFKMIAEIGIIGTFLFLSILILSFWSGFRDLKNKYLDIGIISCLCIIAIGSNIFTYQSVSPIFWYAIGRTQFLIKKQIDIN